MRRACSLVALVAGCTGTLAIDPGGLDARTPGLDAGGPIRDSGPGFDSGPRPIDAGRDAGVEMRVDAGPCAATSLAASFSSRPITGLAAGGAVYARPTGAGGAVLAWPAGGSVRLARVDGAGGLVGGEITVAGDELWGVAANEDGLAALVSRGSDALYLVGTGLDGSPRFEERLLGEVPHDVTNNEWFGNLLRAGRLLWTGSEWAAYFTVQRLWDDGIAHYGDTLRLHAPDGSALSTVWGWGCSHSLEVGLAHNGTGLGPLCVSDCYPGKGVFFNHRTELFLDASGNCMGSIDTRLGGIAAVASGFWVAFASPAGRGSMDVAVQHVSNAGAPGPTVWLTSDATADANVRVAPYGSDRALVAWTAAGIDRLAVIDASGAFVLGPEDVPQAGLAGASDFFALADGDAAWVTTDGGLRFARVRVCR